MEEKKNGMQKSYRHWQKHLSTSSDANICVFEHICSTNLAEYTKQYQIVWWLPFGFPMAFLLCIKVFSLCFARHHLLPIFQHWVLCILVHFYFLLVAQGRGNDGQNQRGWVRAIYCWIAAQNCWNWYSGEGAVVSCLGKVRVSLGLSFVMRVTYTPVSCIFINSINSLFKKKLTIVTAYVVRYINGICQ